MDLAWEDFSDVFLGANDGPPDNVRVASEVLRCRVDDQINAHCEGLARPGSGKCVVNNAHEIVALCDLNHCWNITHFEHRICQCFNVEDFRVWLYCGLV